MKSVPLNSIFNIEYGNQFDQSKMLIAENYDEGINFISRASKNFGISARVLNYKMVEPYPAGLITVTLGGSYLLASFIQPSEFYTAQNIKVLKPIKSMSFNEKLFYCLCIQKNRFKYSSHGREANVSLDMILVPEKMPKKFENLSISRLKQNIKESVINNKLKLDFKKWSYFIISDLFEIHKGQEQIQKCIEGVYPLISAIGTNNGIVSYVEGKRLFNGNCISIAMNGASTGEAFYQASDFYATSDVNVLIPKFKLNKFIALFICTIIKKEKFRFSYGRKWSKQKMEKDVIKLPSKGKILDLEFMENFIKSLPFSKSL